MYDRLKILSTRHLGRKITSSRWTVVVVFKHLHRFSHKEDLFGHSDGNVRGQHLSPQGELLQRWRQHVLLLDQPLHHKAAAHRQDSTNTSHCARCQSLTRSCSSLSCFPLSPPSPKSSSSSSWLAAAPPALGPCLMKNSSLWSSSSPCSIHAASCLYITPWHTARILHNV